MNYLSYPWRVLANQVVLASTRVIGKTIAPLVFVLPIVTFGCSFPTHISVFLRVYVLYFQSLLIGQFISILFMRLSLLPFDLVLL